MFGRRRARRRAELPPRVEAILRKTLEATGLPSGAPLDAPLSTAGLGLDSIEILELLRTVEAECEVRIPDRHWGEKRPRTAGEILDIISR